MKITSKKFNVMQMADKKEEYVVVETFYILGFSWSYMFHYFDFKNAFHLLALANIRKKELETEEKTNQIKRDSLIMIGLITLILTLCLKQ